MPAPSDILTHRVTFRLRSIDRLYLNLCQPLLQTSEQHYRFLCTGQPLPSPPSSARRTRDLEARQKLEGHLLAEFGGARLDRLTAPRLDEHAELRARGAGRSGRHALIADTDTRRSGSSSPARRCASSAKTVSYNASSRSIRVAATSRAADRRSSLMSRDRCP